MTSAATEKATTPLHEEMPLPSDHKAVFLGLLLLIATLWAIYVAQAVVLPIVIALVLKLLLQPLVRLLQRLRIPKALGAALSILLLFGLVAGIGAILSGPTAQFIHDLPDLMARARDKLNSMSGLVERANPFLEPLGITELDPGKLMGSIGAGSMAGGLAGGAGAFASHLLETLLILFYMLVFGDVFMRRLVEVLPHFREKKQAVTIADRVEQDISAYLLTITIINAVVGVACGVVMWACGVPGPLVWGVVAFCLNYIPIIGPFAGVALFAAVSLATFGAAWFVLVPPACYLAIHFAEGEFFTPMLLAKRFTLNPVAVMIALLFWYWLWGVPGAVLSVPLLAITKIVSDRITPLKALGHVLEG